MSALYKSSAAAEVSDRQQRCTCLPFCFWRGGSSRSNLRAEWSRGAEDAPGKKRHRRRRFRLIRLSWLAFSWPPWLRKSGGKKQDCTTRGKKQRRGRRLLLLLKTSLQADKMLASVVSGDSSGLLPATVSSFGDAKKQTRIKPPRPTADGATPGGTRQPQQASTTGAGTRGSTAAPATRPGTSQPCKTTTTDEPAMTAGRVWRAPSRRHSLHQPVRAERPAGLWTAATTLGVIVLLGRVTAVVFLCSCLYGARFVRAWAARGASAKNSGGVASASASSSSRRFGDPVGVAAEKVAELWVTEECKKKVVMAGLLERPGNRPSSRFGR